MRGLLPVLLVALALVPTGAALVQPPPQTGPAMDAAEAQAFLRSWVAWFVGAQEPANASETGVVAGDSAGVWPHAFGDVDGDGRADMLLEAYQWHIEEDAASGMVSLGTKTHFELRLGRDLAKVAWQARPDEEWSGIRGDVDGDGILDLVQGRTTFDYSSTGQAVPTPVAYAGAYQTAYSWDLGGSVVSGADRSTVLGPSAFSIETEDATAMAGSLAGFAVASTSSTTYRTDEVTRNGRSFHSVETRENTNLYSEASAELASATGMYQLREGDSVLAEYTVDGHGRAASFATIDEAASGLLVSWLEGQTGASVDGLPVDAFTPTSGHSILVDDAGNEVWHSVQEGNGILEQIAVPLGDLDGDGVREYEVVSLGIDVLSSSIWSTTRLLSADGSEVVRRDSTNELAVALPFGDVDGDGTMELVWLTEGFTEDIEWEVTSLSGEPLWSMRLGWDWFPENYVADPVALELLAGFSDVDGDGSPDLLFMDWESGAFRLVDGHDGETLWTYEAPVLGWSLAPAVLGTGHDLLLVTSDVDLTESTNTVTISMGGDEAPEAPPGPAFPDAAVLATVVAGRDGSTLFQQELRGPASTPLTASAGVHAAIASIGDTNGNGWSEIAVTLTELGEVESATDTYTYTFRGGPATVYVIALDQDRPLLALTPNSTDGTPTADIPAPSRGLALQESLKGNDSPGVPLGILLAALATMLVLRRRR